MPHHATPTGASGIEDASGKATCANVEETEESGFAWTDGAAEVRIECYGEQIIACSGFAIRMSLEDTIMCATFLREPELALFVDMTVNIGRRLRVPFMCADAQRVFYTENAGGASEMSEAFSMELLYRTLGARLGKTELELEYFTGDGRGSKLTDFSIVLECGTVIGVSVTRACKGWPCLAYTTEDALRLLNKKLLGVNESSRYVSNTSWQKQLLHVFVPDAAVLAALVEATSRLRVDTIANTVILFTLCTGAHVADIFKRDPCMPPPQKKAKIALGLKSAEHLQNLCESEPKTALFVSANTSEISPGACSCRAHHGTDGSVRAHGGNTRVGFSCASCAC